MAHSLYIHIPFCRSKCTYCDFFSVPVNSAVSDEYVCALVNEIDYRLKNNLPDKIHTVYIGGGTPSLLKHSCILKICDAVKPFMEKDFQYEWTIEANPDDLTSEFLHVLKKGGINRLSCGIQAFDDQVLSAVRRRSSLECVKKCFELVENEWEGQFSVDLISGLPKQDPKKFLKGLEAVLSYSPDHVSLYSLSIEEGTVLEKEIRSGALKYNFDDADQMWLLGRNFLEHNGYEQYEVSNFVNARTGIKSAHNLAYWNSLDYIGCGSAATGTVRERNKKGLFEGFRWTNSKKIEEYVSFWLSFSKDKNFCCLPEENERLDEETLVFEYFMMGLRVLSGVCIESFCERFEREFPRNVLDLGLEWQDEGKALFYEREGRHFFCLTKKGILFLNDFLRKII